LCWIVPLNNAQMGLGAVGELQLWSRGAKGRPHTSFLYPIPSWHLPKGILGLAALNGDTVNWLQATAHGIGSKSAHMKKKTIANSNLSIAESSVFIFSKLFD